MDRQREEHVPSHIEPVDRSHREALDRDGVVTGRILVNSEDATVAQGKVTRHGQHQVSESTSSVVPLDPFENRNTVVLLLGELSWRATGTLASHIRNATLSTAALDSAASLRSAAAAFQDRHGLAVDGIVGPNTWAKLAGVRA